MNKLLRCQDCGHLFVFTKEQQEYFKTNNWPPPIRCPICRMAKHILKHPTACVPQKREKAVCKLRRKNKGLKGWFKRMFPKKYSSSYH